MRVGEAPMEKNICPALIRPFVLGSGKYQDWPYSGTSHEALVSSVGLL